MTVEDRRDTMLDLLIAGVREEPGAEKFLHAVTEPAARVEEYLALRRGKLSDLLDPSLVPDEQVVHLAHLVGWGPEYPPGATLDTESRRRIASSAVRMWRDKGTQPTLRAAIVAMTGRRTIFEDWFQRRILGGTSWGEFTAEPEPGSAISAYPYSNAGSVTDLWLMDPSDELDLDKVARVVRPFLPSGERVNMRRALHLDDLLHDTEAWTVGSSGNGGYAPAAKYILSQNGREYIADGWGTQGTWSGTHVRARAAINGRFELYTYLQADNLDDGYLIRVRPASATVELHRRVATVDTLLDSVSGVRLQQNGTPYDFRISAWNTTTSTDLTVWVSGIRVLQHSDTHASRHTAGGMGWRAFPVPTAFTRLYGAITIEHSTPVTRIGLAT